MNKHDVRGPEQALAYITDCTLATVQTLAMKKSRNQNEFLRQISIAQAAVDWMVDMKVDCSLTRAHEVVACENHSVLIWIEPYVVEKTPRKKR